MYIEEYFDNESRMDIEHSMKVLAKYTNTALLYFKGYKYKYFHVFDENIGFHPNGKCGCVEVNDDYLCGIRCDHLMWAEGDCECAFHIDEDNIIDDPNDIHSATALFIYGNHKGQFEAYIIAFEYPPNIIDED